MSQLIELICHYIADYYHILTYIDIYSKIEYKLLGFWLIFLKKGGEK
jgi:hypothetical protein